MKRDEILERWESRQREWDALHVQVDGAAVARQVIEDLEALLSDGADEALTLTQASEISGYSTEHLSRLIRAGTVANAGRKGAPRIKRKDLPMRPTAIASGNALAYDAVTDARRLRVRR